MRRRVDVRISPHVPHLHGDGVEQVGDGGGREDRELKWLGAVFRGLHRHLRWRTYMRLGQREYYKAARTLYTLSSAEPVTPFSTPL